MEVAETIVRQLGQSTARLGLMVGAHTFTGRPEGLTFKFKAKAKNQANCVRVTLSPDDTYKVEFLRLSGVNVWTKGSFEGVYAEDLKRIFERETGLYLSL
jgi:hypothetical protein